MSSEIFFFLSSHVYTGEPLPKNCVLLRPRAGYILANELALITRAICFVVSSSVDISFFNPFKYTNNSSSNDKKFAIHYIQDIIKDFIAIVREFLESNAE
eukprot:401673_1